VTRRPDALVSPDGHPEPECRDLIGARLCVTRHSIVRSLPLIGWKLMVTAKGADDVTKIDVERPDTEVETILGVDTHLDFHVAVAVDHLGRRLSELSVPTTVKGYERLRKAPPLGGTFWPPQVCRGRRYKQLRGRTHPPPGG
jgi:hypothetical protein